MQNGLKIQYLPADKKESFKLSNWQFLKKYEFYEVADLNATLNQSIPYFIKEYNDSLPSSKGRISGNTTQVFIQMVKIAFIHMEGMRKDALNARLLPENRKHFFREYIDVLAHDFDCVSFLSNRGQIKTMVNNAGGSISSLTTVSNAIRRLENADFLKRSKKINTSRCRIRSSKIVTMCEEGKKGRGDVKYFLDKKVFVWCFKIMSSTSIDVNKQVNLVENQNNKTSTAIFSSAENQSLTSPKTQKLYQPSHVNGKETLKTFNNNGGKATEIKGVPSSQNKNKTSLHDGNKKEGNKIDKFIHPNNPNPSVVKFEKKEGNRVAPREKSATKYLDRLKKADDIDRKMPEKEEDMYALMLWQMCLRLIFIPFGWSLKSLLPIEKEAKRMLKAQMWRLGYDNLEEAFSTVAYAILKAHNWLEKANIGEKSFKPYHALTYLNPDLHYEKGLLRHVIDGWVISKEFKNLWNRKLEYKKQTSNMMCRQAAFKWFRKFVEAFREGGFSSGLMQMRFGEKQIKIYCGRMKVSNEVRDAILKDYANGVSSISAEMQKLGNEDEINVFDMAWKAFQNNPNPV